MKSGIESLHPSIRGIAAAFLADAKASGVDLVFNEGYRPNERQAQLYSQGRTAPGARVTNAKAGQSNHNYGFAFDVVPRAVMGKKNWDPNNPLWQQVGSLAQKHGFEWGGNWKSKDMPHIQARGTSWKKLQGLPVENGYVRLPGSTASAPVSNVPGQPRQIAAGPSITSPEPMAQQFAPMQAPGQPFGDLIAPNATQTVAIPPQPQFGDFLLAMQARQKQKAEEQAAEQTRLAALFGENMFGPFG